MLAEQLGGLEKSNFCDLKKITQAFQSGTMSMESGVYGTKQGERPVEMSLWKRPELPDTFKSLEKR